MHPHIRETLRVTPFGHFIRSFYLPVALICISSFYHVLQAVVRFFTLFLCIITRGCTVIDIEYKSPRFFSSERFFSL